MLRVVLLLAAVACGAWAKNPATAAKDPKYLYVCAGAANGSAHGGKDAVIVGG